MKQFEALRWIGVALALSSSVEGRVVAAQETSLKPSASEECRLRLEKFVSELDALLDTNNRSLSPVTDLLRRYFPLVSCDVDAAIDICKRSKYLVTIESQRDLYVITFTNANPKSPSHSGFDITFGLLKKSGDSKLPFARVRP